MLENKNHKKISLSGKSLLMGTLSTAAIVLSTSTANAATNESNTTASQNQTPSLTNVETKNTNNSQSIQRNEKVANQAANINEAPVGSAPVLDTPSSATDTTPGTDLSNNGSESVITDNSKNNDSKKKNTTQDISEKPELKGKIKDIVKNSGINADDLNSDQINNLNKVTFEASGTFSMPYMEKTGAPLSRFHEIVLRGIKDPRSQYKTYFGELENDYSLEAGFEKECFSFLYIVTDNTGREMERAIFLTGCQPQSVAFSELYESTKGDIQNPEISLEYSYHMIESKEINKIAREILDWQNNDLNSEKIIKNSYDKEFAAVDSLVSYSESNSTTSL